MMLVLHGYKDIVAQIRKGATILMNTVVYNEYIDSNKGDDDDNYDDDLPLSYEAL